MNDVIILIINNIVLLTACGLLWYRGLIYKKKLRYWRNQALKLNAQQEYGKNNNVTGAPWLKK